jgi:hypothetical protein
MPPKKKVSSAPVEKDDGTRWIVVDKDGFQIYPGKGVTKRQADLLSKGLIQESSLEQVN